MSLPLLVFLSTFFPPTAQLLYGLLSSVFAFWNSLIFDVFVLWLLFGPAISFSFLLWACSPSSNFALFSVDHI